MYAVVVEWWSVGETGADKLDKQLTVEENHDCSSQNETLLQNKLMIVAGGVGSEVWNRVYLIAPVKKFGRVRLNTNFF